MLNMDKSYLIWKLLMSRFQTLSKYVIIKQGFSNLSSVVASFQAQVLEHPHTSAKRKQLNETQTIPCLLLITPTKLEKNPVA